MANENDHKELIEQARKDESKLELLDDEGERAAWWVTCEKKEFDSITSNPYDKTAFRRRKIDDGEMYEVLVVADPYNLTDVYLAEVKADKDENKQPCISFRFNAEGTRKFAALTKANAPSFDRPQVRRHLGVIVEGKLLSAPGIMSAITGGSGRITGNFTQEQIESLVERLKAAKTSYP